MLRVKKHSRARNEYVWNDSHVGTLTEYTADGISCKEDKTMLKRSWKIWLKNISTTLSSLCKSGRLVARATIFGEMRQLAGTFWNQRKIAGIPRTGIRSVGAAGPSGAADIGTRHRTLPRLLEFLASCCTQQKITTGKSRDATWCSRCKREQKKKSRL